MRCVLFDLDGTLVDSERLGHQAILDVSPDLGETVESLTNQHRGVELAATLRALEAKHDFTYDENIVPRYRARMAELFETDLQAFPGADAMLQAIQQPKCIASGGPLEKIRRSLRITGLAKHFGENLYSSYEINSWKPKPDLFLHAAESMGYAPQDCVVIEDSKVGVEAALAAGMTVFHFGPESGIELGGSGVQGFSRLEDLITLLA